MYEKREMFFPEAEPLMGQYDSLSAKEQFHRSVSTSSSQLSERRIAAVVGAVAGLFFGAIVAVAVKHAASTYHRDG